jgi:ribosome-binding protein aMBF1 (putative translation factor)
MLGDEVRRARLRLGLSQTALAKKVHKSRSWLCKVERNEFEPSWPGVRALFRELALDPHLVLCLVTPEDTPHGRSDPA